LFKLTSQNFLLSLLTCFIHGFDIFLGHLLHLFQKRISGCLLK
jgi:hypothetical protein